MIRIGMIAYGFERPSPPSFVSYTLELAKALVHLGRDLEIVLLSTSRRGLDRLGAQFSGSALPACTLLPGLMTVGNFAIARAARSLRLDIVHDPTGVTPFALQSLYGGTKSVATVHDLVSYVYPQTHTSLTNFLQRVWLPLGLKQASAVVTVSEHSKSDLCRYLSVSPGKVQVVPCGVTPRFNPTVVTGERVRLAERYNIQRPYILYLGDVQARKNVHGLLHAFAQLRPALPGHMLVIAGAATWKYKAIYRTVEQLNLQADVLFTGFVEDNDVPALYRQAELFVFPSLYEGFGRPPLEAMACGTPVVVSNVSSLPEVVGDAALLVNPYDASDIAASMQRVLSDRHLAQQLREKGLKRAHQFTWEQAAVAIADVYQHLMTGTLKSRRQVVL